MKRYKIRGKVYTEIETLTNNDPDIFKKISRLKDCKGGTYTMYQTYRRYSIYDSDNKLFARVNSISEYA